MKLVSKAALATALAIGTPAMLAAPAFAQKKEKAPQVQASKEFRAAYVPAEAAVKAKDVATAEPAVAAVEAVAKSEDEQLYAAQLRYDLETAKQNRAGQTAALDRLIANPKLSPEMAPNANLVRGRMAVEAKRYAEALPYLTRARQLGNTSSDLALQIAVANLESGNIDVGVAEIDNAIKAEQAAGKKPPEEWYKFAVSKLYHNNRKPLAAQWLTRQLQAYPSATAWRSAVMIYMEQSAEKGGELDRDQKIDLYRLLRANKALAGESDYFTYADATLKRGLPWETVKVIEEGRLVGKTNSVSFTQMYASAQAGVKSEGSLAGLEKTARAAANGKTALSTADAYLATGDYTKAADLYRVALQKGGVANDLANTRLGIALALGGQKGEAKQALASVTTGPRAEIARFWTTWIDQGTAGAAATTTGS